MKKYIAVDTLEELSAILRKDSGVKKNIYTTNMELKKSLMHHPKYKIYMRKMIYVPRYLIVESLNPDHINMFHV